MYILRYFYKVIFFLKIFLDILVYLMCIFVCNICFIFLYVIKVYINNLKINFLKMRMIDLIL